MKRWFNSPDGSIALSLLALLSLLARSYVDTRYILVEDYADQGMGFVIVWILAFTLIIGGWIWALLAAARGSRRALIGMFVYALLTGVGAGAASILLFTSQLAEVFIFTASLVTGLAASISIAFQLRIRRKR
jgi:hypothetical protein